MVIVKEKDGTLGKDLFSSSGLESGTEENEAKRADGVSFPCRNIFPLYTSKSTLNCAISKLCRPCAYKIGCFDVAQDKQFTMVAPNQRPEQCPRSQNSDHIEKQISSSSFESYLGYYPAMNILTVGDGDFSFSLALTRILKNINAVKNEKDGLVIVSSYESQSTLESIYPKINDTITELRCLGAHVLFELDATCIQKHKILSKLLKKHKVKFHRMIWNFPCTAEPNGQDGQNQEMDKNKYMIRQFILCADSLLHKKNGEIHMAHKTKPPYDQWGLRDINSSKICAPAKICQNIIFHGHIVLDRCSFHPYTPRKALDKKSFTCHDACIFVFGRKQVEGSSNEIKSTSSRSFLWTLPIVSQTYASNEKTDVVLVTKAMIHEIRSLHYSEALKKKNKVKKGKNKRALKEIKTLGSIHKKGRNTKKRNKSK